MPTLKRVADTDTDTAPTKAVDKRSRSKLATKKPPSDDGDCCSDDRFSQPTDYLGETRKTKKARNNTKDPSSDIVSPFCIASAIRNHRLDDVLRTQHDKSNSSSATTDVVAVVLSTAIRQAPLPSMALSHSKTPKRSTGSRIHLLIGDRSLPRGKCARVSTTVSSNVHSSLAALLGVDGMGGNINSSISSPATLFHVTKKENAQSTVGWRLGQLQPGDVVRWNRLEVRNDYDDNDSASPAGNNKGKKLSNNPSEDDNSSSDNPLLSVTCDLSMSWRDPAAGPSLTRLCRIIPKSSSCYTSARMQSTGEEHDECYDLEWENNIPPSMETSKDIVVELASWYCANARPHFSKSTAILPTNQPCQRRKLRDINAPNLRSHVVVKVLRCEKAISKYATPRKATKFDPVVTHVTFSDGAETDDLLGMGASVNHGRVGGAFASLPKAMSSILLQALKEGSHVLLTHILSHSTNPALQGRESLVLVPTRETTATILTPEHPYYVHGKLRREEENPFASQPLTLERASQLFSMTQQNSPPIMKDESILPSHCRGAMVVVAPLKDIIVDGIASSLMEGSHWQAPHKLSKFLIYSPSISTGFEAIKLSPSYRSATLILDPNSVSNEIVVNADGDALKLLCVDIPVEDMVVYDPTTSNPYIGHVGDLLKALCTGSIPIRWVLEQESECNWFVTNATLLEI